MKWMIWVVLATVAFWGCQNLTSPKAEMPVADTLATTQARKAFNEGKVIQTIKELSSDAYQGRKPGTEGHNMAKKFILHVFDSLKLKKIGNSYEQPFSATLRGDTEATPAANLVAYIPGTKDSSTYIVVGAHYDHVGISKGQIHNGADDNASGVGGLLAVADYFTKNPPKNSILLLAFDAEESGLLGAKHFVANPLVPLEKIAVMINMDMISRSESKEVYACGVYHSPFLKPFLDEAGKENPAMRLRQGHDLPRELAGGEQDWTQSSDHGPFHNAQVPFIYFGVEDHPHYHKPSDDFETINAEFYLNAVNLVLTTVEKIDQGMKSISKAKKK